MQATSPSAAAAPRGFAPTRGFVVLVVGAAIVIGMLGEHVADSWLQPTWIPVVDLAIGWLMVACGLVAMDAQPGQPAGGRLVLAGFLWFVGTYGGPGRGPVGAIGFAFQGYYDLVLAILALSFAARWPAWRPARLVLVVAAVLYAAQSVIRLVFTAPDTIGVPILGDDTLVAWVDVLRAGALVVAGVVMLAQLARTPRTDRSHAGPVLLAGAASAAAAGFGAQYALSVLGFLPDAGDSLVAVSWAFNIVRIVVPLAILVGVLRLRTARAAIAGAIAGVGPGASTGALREALATALGDPGLRILAWDPEAGAYREPDGSVVAGDDLGALEASQTRSLVRVDDVDGPLAAILLARPAADDPALVGSGVALTRLVVRGERLADRIRDQLDEVSASRARIVDAADAERRRIERDLHDGLQQQMLGIAMNLRAAEDRPEAREEALRRGSAEVLALLEGVRELARGIHPAVLSDRGLQPALEALCRRSTIPVEIAQLPDDRLPAQVESAAYLVVEEALANLARYSEATYATVSVARHNGHALVEVRDDGVGGADPSRGNGLRTLVDRLGALDGSLELVSAPGEGTIVYAEIPCA